MRADPPAASGASAEAGTRRTDLVAYDRDPRTGLGVLDRPARVVHRGRAVR